MNSQSGFTFVEVLVALLVAAILITVACTALITSLRAEQRAAILQQGRFVLQTEATRAWMDTVPASRPADPHWSAIRTAPSRESESEDRWTILELASRDDPAIAFRLALEERTTEE